MITAVITSAAARVTKLHHLCHTGRRATQPSQRVSSGEGRPPLAAAGFDAALASFQSSGARRCLGHGCRARFRFFTLPLGVEFGSIHFGMEMAMGSTLSYEASADQAPTQNRKPPPDG